MKRALITGITGQDGAYLAHFLLNKGYEVHGLRRVTSFTNSQRFQFITSDERLGTHFFLHDGDILDPSCLQRLVQLIQPDEVYNLAAQSHVHVSFSLPKYTTEVNGLGTLNILEAIRLAGLASSTRFYQASTSELYGISSGGNCTEKTEFNPRSPYAAAKLYAYWLTVNYREAYGMFAVNGILFNHESPLRGETFVTRKISMAVAAIKFGIQNEVILGKLDSVRDWGYAPEYVDGMWRMLQVETPEDFILATGQGTSVRKFVELAFAAADIQVNWKGSRGTEHEVGVDVRTGKVLIRVSPSYYRPTEVSRLVGDYSKAKEKLRWVPSTTVEEVAQIMVRADLSLLSGRAGSSNRRQWPDECKP